ncbi:MAG: radical SAM protein [bacterium]|nr:radical SAM protein [bacterium]
MSRRLSGKGRDLIREAVRNRPTIKRMLIEADANLDMWKHSLAGRFPSLIQPRTRKMTVAITAQCNLRCVGCRYGRDFMLGDSLSLEMVKSVMDDGRAGGAETIRLYGGEPLLHKDLPAMIEHGLSIGLRVYVTSNGVLLEQRIDELYTAGLRDITLGYYGTGATYDAYVQRSERYVEMEKGIAAIRERCGDDMNLQLNYLVMRPSCEVESLEKAWEFALRYNMTFHTDLVHYSLPYFTQGLDQEIQFRPEDMGKLNLLTERLVQLKHQYPNRITESLASLRSIPDWLSCGPDMRIPCDVYNMVWIGADGSVKLCYVTFDLGNLHDKPLAEILYSDVHVKASQGAFNLDCPNCHCERDSRIRRHRGSQRWYGE